MHIKSRLSEFSWQVVLALGVSAGKQKRKRMVSLVFLAAAHFFGNGTVCDQGGALFLGNLFSQPDTYKITHEGLVGFVQV